MTDPSAFDLAILALRAVFGGNAPCGSVGAARMRGGLPAVVAIRFAFPVDSANLLARRRCADLVPGHPIDMTVTEARHLYGIDAYQLDWAISALFLRGNDGALLSSAIATSAVPPPHGQVPVRTANPAPDKQRMVPPPNPVRRTWLLILSLVVLLIALAVAIRTPTPIPVPTEVPIEFVDVPDGPFLMGARDTELSAYTTDHVSFSPYTEERPQHSVTLPSYAISKTQVTNAQFRPFVTGNGYSDPAYWSSAGWAWREKNNVSAPAFWADPYYNADNLPVVGVSWYEALAYCRWLSSKTGADIQLPTEAEWEKAARGTDGRIYPWGDTWDQAQAYQQRTTSGPMDPIAVGSYPAGASPYGVLDMAGTVSEWTRSAYRPYPYDPNDGREDGIDPAQKRFAVRSGGWHFQSIDFRTSKRGSLTPDARYYNLGMRLAQHSSSVKH